MGRMSFRKRRGACALAWLVSAGFAPCAQGQHVGDIRLTMENGQVITSGHREVEGGGVVFVPGLRVFPGSFGEFPNFTDDPGFEAVAGGLPAGALVGFNILDALRKWDGQDFDAIPAETLRVSLGGAFRTTPAGAGEFVAGFNFAQVSAGGGVHQHINYFLNPPQSAGIYRFTLEVTATGLSDSEPVFIIFNQNDSEANHDAAVQYMIDMLTPPECEGDLDGDADIDSTDLNILLTDFGCTSPPDPPCDGDLDGDGDTDSTDLNIQLSVFGQPCG